MSIYTEPVKSEDATALVERTFKMSGPMQMFREIPVNAAQAGATELRIDVAWGLVEQGKPYFASFEDDGEGMSPHDMPLFLNRFGGSGRTIGVTEENFGVGFKTSTWPVNDHGVVVLTLRDGVTSMTWCHRNPESGVLGARALIDPDAFEGGEYEEALAESGSPSVLVLSSPHGEWEEMVIDGIDWMKVMPQWIKDAGHGTAFIMLGMDGTTDTFGKYGCWTDPSKYGPLKEMSRRFWNLDLNVKLRNFDNFTDRNTWPTFRPESGGWRNVVTAMNHVFGADYVTHSGSYTTTASSVPARIDWFIFDEGRERGSQAGDRISHPFRAVTHEAHSGIVELLDVRSGAKGGDRAYGTKGVSPFIGPRSVAKNIGIAVTPTGGDVFIDGSRTVLLHTHADGTTDSMPWEEWATEFRANQPEAIKALVEAHYSESTTSGEVTAEERRTLAQRFLGFLRGTTTRLVPAEGGTETASTETTESSQGHIGSTNRRRRRRGGDRPDDTTVLPGPAQAARATTRSADLPEPRWETQEEFDPGCAVRYDETSHVVMLNRDHFFVKQTDDYIRNRYVDESAEQIDRRIQATRGAMLTNVMLGTAFAIGNARRNPTSRSALLSEVALTALLADLRGHLAEGMALYGQENQRRAS